MKKVLLTTLGVSALGLAAYSITYMRVLQTDGTESEIAVDKVNQVDFLEKEVGGSASSTTHEYVDLGLPSGTLWATYNIGATKPEEIGEYYSWGETETKDFFNWSTYKWCISNNGGLDFLTKYNSGHRYNGKIDNLQTLLSQDDVASAKWGSEWRMPTNEEFQELLDNCQYNWTEYNGVYGAKFTASNGNSMFLPVGGYYESSTIYDTNSRGFYWSSSLLNDYEFCALNVYFRSEGVGMNAGNRRLGFPVRSVRCEKKLPTDTTATVNDTTSIAYEYVDLGLPSGTLWATFNVGATKPEEYGDYFAWGETKPKDVYDWSTYKWAKPNSSENSSCYIKYFSGSYDLNDFTGVIDNLTTLLPEDDAATANWGVDWSMPTKNDIEELIKYCEFSWTELNGVNGARYTASNGNSIFIPAAGYQSGSFRNVSSSDNAVFILSSTIHEELEAISYNLYISPYGPDIQAWMRETGYPVRPIRSKKSTNTESPIIVKDTSTKHEYVDLDLPSGTLWATCNVGATDKSDNGYYFAWGETEPKSVYDCSTYKWAKTNGKYGVDSLTKYNSGKYFPGTIDNLTTLLPEDDAATVNWGPDWRMPTKEEIEELINYCNIGEVNYGGGLSLLSYNGNSLYIPSACGRYGSDTNNSGTGSFSINYVSIWSSSLDENSENRAQFINYKNYGGFSSLTAILNISDYERYYGFPIRPVFVKKSKEITFVDTTYKDTASTHEYVDLGLPSGTLWATHNVGATKPEEYGNYFAWGETKPKKNDIFHWGTYKWAKSFYDVDRSNCGDFAWLLSSIKKYKLGRLSCWGISSTDNLTTLQPEDDAATANWGTEWHTPTKEEINELIENCIYSDTTINGITGSKYTAPNGNSIFMPAGGYYFDSYYYKNYGNLYWSSSLGDPDEYAYTFYGEKIDNTKRYYGCLVRPVRSKK